MCAQREIDPRHRHEDLRSFVEQKRALRDPSPTAHLRSKTANYQAPGFKPRQTGVLYTDKETGVTVPKSTRLERGYGEAAQSRLNEILKEPDKNSTIRLHSKASMAPFESVAS